jgi:hypothetical protein
MSVSQRISATTIFFKNFADPTHLRGITRSSQK